jgi:FkbM family methyltransferase
MARGSLRQRLARSQSPAARWLVALLRSARYTLRDGVPVRIWQSRDGLFHHRAPEAAFVSTELHEQAYAAVEAAVRDHWLHGGGLGPGDVVVDVGAGIGDEAIVFSRMVGPAGRVVAVEAHPRTFACLARTVALNGLANVQAVHAALSDRDGTLRIAFGESYLTSRVGDLAAADAGADADAADVPAMTLDGLLDAAGIERVDLLKVNIEGAEAPMLRASSLDRVRRIAVSCHDFIADGSADPSLDTLRTFEEVRGLLAAAGFRLRTRFDDPRPWIRYYLYGDRR